MVLFEVEYTSFLLPLFLVQFSLSFPPTEGTNILVGVAVFLTFSLMNEVVSYSIPKSSRKLHVCFVPCLRTNQFLKAASLAFKVQLLKEQFCIHRDNQTLEPRPNISNNLKLPTLKTYGRTNNVRRTSTPTPTHSQDWSPCWKSSNLTLITYYSKY